MLLVGDRSSAGISGADLDIMKALMDFLSGGSTNYIGNYCTVGATNKPTGTEDALRQRFVYRAVVNGPSVWEDYVDQVALELRSFAKTGLLEASTGKYKPLSRPAAVSVREGYPEELLKRYTHKREYNLDDIGKLCEELRQKDPKFTGRSVKNAIQVAVARAADFEIPEPWVTDPAAFRAKPWDSKLLLLKKLYSPLTAEMIMMSLEYQFEVEYRYRREAEAKEIQEQAKRYYVDAQARVEFKDYEKGGRR